MAFDEDGSLSVEDIAAALEAHVQSSRGKSEPRPAPSPAPSPPTSRKKSPCVGSKLPEIDRTLPEIQTELGEIRERQNMLANAVLVSFDDMARRLRILERRPTPFWTLGPLQKGCLLLFTMISLSFMALFFLAVLSHYAGIR